VRGENAFDGRQGRCRANFIEMLLIFKQALRVDAKILNTCKREKGGEIASSSAFNVSHCVRKQTGSQLCF